MPKEYMVGTVDDQPLLIVIHENVRYYVNTETKEVFEDKPKLPSVKDKDLIKAVLKAAK